MSDYLLSHPAEVVSLLRELAAKRVLVTLASSCGACYPTLLREVDALHGLLHFEAEPSDHPALARLLDAEEVLAIGYLDRIRVQFEPEELALGAGNAAARSLSCALPAELLRFQRRSGYRVRPLLGTLATARFQRPGAPAAFPLTLRVLDVSIGGIGLLLPEPRPEFAPGVRLVPVEIELDADTRFDCGLRILHVSRLNGDAPAVRLGCEITNIADLASRALQRFIDRTQRHRRRLERAPD